TFSPRVGDLGRPSPTFGRILCARLRADFSFGEQIIDIADNTSDDWLHDPGTDKLRVNKEFVLRSKIRIEARQFHMSRLHPQTWGDRKQIDIKNDWAFLGEDERRRKAEELIAMIRELKEPPMQRPPLVYHAEEPAEDDDQQQRGIGSPPRRAIGPKA